MARRTHLRFPGARRLPPVGEDFVSIEALGGIALLGATIAALVWANSPWSEAYADLWNRGLQIGIGSFSIDEDLRHWVNDGLMTLFFFVVGLEIKRELVEGDLRDPRTAALPAIAALGGMAVPALLYVAINWGEPGSDGWGIPVATDIAFALGVLTLLGNRVHLGLRLFLLTLAIVDDIGAILVIAVFYSDDLAPEWLGGAVATLLVFFLLRLLGVRRPIWYVLPAVVLWVCTLESGVHATIAGVVLGLLAPAARPDDRRRMHQMEERIHPWTSFLVIPVFALANAGVELGGGALGDALSGRIGIGVIAGLVIGKPLGIGIAVAAAVGLKLGRPPRGVGARQLIGAASLAGIGFTVALFIAELSFTDERHLAEAKIGILVASIAAATVGVLVLAVGRRSRTVSKMTTVALVGDLMDRSKISAVVPNVSFAGNVTSCEGADLVVIDLGRYADQTSSVRALAPGARIVAYGRHDSPEVLAQARADGADAALTRNRFFSDPAAAVAVPADEQA